MAVDVKLEGDLHKPISFKTIIGVVIVILAFGITAMWVIPRKEDPISRQIAFRGQTYIIQKNIFSAPCFNDEVTRSIMYDPITQTFMIMDEEDELWISEAQWYKLYKGTDKQLKTLQ